MDLVLADDSKQRKPSRPQMRAMVAAGGLHVPGESVGALERKLNSLCDDFEFPAREEFKWSPGRRDWMHRNLVESARAEFFRRALEHAQEEGASAVVVAEDTKARPAVPSSRTAEEDVVTLLLERIDNHCRSTSVDALVIADRPGGDRETEHRFLSDCLETMQVGTSFVRFGRLSMVLTSDSKHARLLQLADVVTSCTLSLIAGEERFAPDTFRHIEPLLRREAGRVGGVGVKIHPDLRYCNLYHWLFGDSHIWRNGVGHPLPLRGQMYYASATDPNLM